MNGKILFLDDDLDLLSTYQEVIQTLTQKGAICYSSFADLRSNRGDALSCDAAFLDINLGESKESGIEAAKWFQENGFKGRIFFLTGHARSHPLVAQACASGTITVLQKPIDVDHLLELIEGRSF